MEDDCGMEWFKELYRRGHTELGYAKTDAFNTQREEVKLLEKDLGKKDCKTSKDWTNKGVTHSWIVQAMTGVLFVPQYSRISYEEASSLVSCILVISLFFLNLFQYLYFSNSKDTLSLGCTQAAQHLKYRPVQTFSLY